MGVRVYDPEQQLGHIELVDQRDDATLLPIIQKVVVPGSIAWSDEWAAYRQLSSLGFTHQTVNHSEHFKDPATGTCTNHVEAYWCAVKRRFKSMCGTTNEMLPAYEHMWRERYGRTAKQALLRMQHHMAERHLLSNSIFSTALQPALFRATHILGDNSNAAGQ